MGALDMEGPNCFKGGLPHPAASVPLQPLERPRPSCAIEAIGSNSRLWVSLRSYYSEKMKCTTSMCGELTQWRCPQRLPCDPTWQQRAFGYYKTGTGKNLFCYKCCAARVDWRDWILAKR